MSRRTLAILTTMLLVLLLGSLLAACGGAKDETAVPATEQVEVEVVVTATPVVVTEEATPAALEGKTLLQERCTQCHDLGRVERAKKAKEEWKATMERMVGKGAKLNQTEQALVIQYLAETYPQ